MKVAILTPVHGDPKTAYVRSLAEMLVYTAEQRKDLTLRPRLGQGHLINNRNALAADALGWNADFVLWIDADTSFPAHSLVSLLAHDLPIVGCNCPTKTHPPRTTAFRAISDGKFEAVFTTEEIAKRTPIEEVTHLGLGLCLIAAPILAELEQPTFQAKPGHRMNLGEDESLFERIRAKGGRIFVDHRLSLEVAHIGDYAFTNQIAAHFGRTPG
jgi:hypothetical protein